jgi:hypothetical protein
VSSVTVGVDVLPPGDVDLDGSLQFSVDGQPLGDPIDLTGYDGVTVTIEAPGTPTTSTIAASYLGGQSTNPSAASLTQTVLAALTQPSPAPTNTTPTTTPAPTTGAGVPSADKALAAMTAALRKTLTARGLRALNGLTESFTAPSPGRVEQGIYSPTAPKSALAARATTALLARASARFERAGTGKVKVKLTAAGRRALRRSGSVKVAIVTRFTPTSGKAVRRVDRITARGRLRHASLRLTLPSLALGARSRLAGDRTARSFGGGAFVAAGTGTRVRMTGHVTG